MFSKLEIQFVSITAICSHEFAYTTAETNDRGITPLPMNEVAKEIAKSETITCLKSVCPRDEEAMEYILGKRH